MIGNARLKETIRQGKSPRGPKARGGQKSQSQSNEEYIKAAENLIVLMDEYGVGKCLLMPPPQIPEQSKKVNNNYKNCLEVVNKFPDRFVLVAGGGTLNPLIYGTDAESVTDQVRKKFEQQAKILIENGVRAFGEMSVLHVAMAEHHNYSQAPADHPLFLLLADIAAKNNFAIDIHMEAVVSDQAIVDSLKQVSHNPKIIPATIGGFENLLIHNRGAKIVWQHIGWDNTGGTTPELLRKLLAKHPNLYLALRREEGAKAGRSFTPNRIADESGKLYPQWLKLINDFPERIMIGSDEFVGIPGKTKRMPQSFEETWSILKQLSKETAEKVGRLNAKRVYSISD